MSSHRRPDSWPGWRAGGTGDGGVIAEVSLDDLPSLGDRPRYDGEAVALRLDPGTLRRLVDMGQTTRTLLRPAHWRCLGSGRMALRGSREAFGRESGNQFSPLATVAGLFARRRLLRFFGDFGDNLESLEPASGHQVQSECYCRHWPLDNLQGYEGDVARNEQNVSFVAPQDRVDRSQWVRQAPCWGRRDAVREIFCRSYLRRTGLRWQWGPVLWSALSPTLRFPRSCKV